MTEKIRLFIIDNDLRIRESGDYEIGDSNKIRLKSGGTENWNPKIGPLTFVEKPSWKKYLIYGQRGWRREYYVRKKHGMCINFGTNDNDTAPDLEAIDESIASTQLNKIGQPEQKGQPWQLWATFIFSLLSFILILNIAGVIH